MNTATFEKFRSLIYDTVGIVLSDNKRSLLEARIGKRLRALKIDDPKDYLHHIINDDESELGQLVDAISTNVTSFFREKIHLEALAQETKTWFDGGQRRFRFWSAACSSGEEPISMVLSILEKIDLNLCDIRVLATDISTKILAQCAEGIYAADKATTIPPHMVSKYFTKKRDGDKKMLQVNPLIQRLITYKQLNLTLPPYPMQGPMDAIFCRNVMIYFDVETRQRLINEYQRLLKPGGFLMIGHSESLSYLKTSLRTVSPSVYQKID